MVTNTLHGFIYTVAIYTATTHHYDYHTITYKVNFPFIIKSLKFFILKWLSICRNLILFIVSFYITLKIKHSNVHSMDESLHCAGFKIDGRILSDSFIAKKGGSNLQKISHPIFIKHIQQWISSNPVCTICTCSHFSDLHSIILRI